MWNRSITDPLAFVTTNVIGTVNLLNAFRDTWKAGFLTAIAFTMCLPMKYMVRWTMAAFLPKARITIRNHLILLPKPAPTIL